MRNSLTVKIISVAKNIILEWSQLIRATEQQETPAEVILNIRRVLMYSLAIAEY